MIETNLGFLPTPDVRLPPQSIAAYLYGRPEFYAGESGALALAAALAPQCDAFLDVGAHRGYFTFWVRHSCPTLPVFHAFEPDPRLYALLCDNIARLAPKNVVAHNSAVAASTGKLTFHMNLDDELSGSLTTDFTGHHRTREIEVQTVALAEFLQGHGIERALVKVDVEGAEAQFLEGGRAAAERLGFLIIEVLGPAFSSGIVSRIRQQLGMECYYIDRMALRHSSDGTFTYRPGEYNWLFCRLQPHELRDQLRQSRLSVARG